MNLSNIGLAECQFTYRYLSMTGNIIITICVDFMNGDLLGEMPNSIRVYYKVGVAYGTLTDLA